ncbi:MAG: OmpA family protein [Bacteroidales bacterium]|nr:OmpA family protein [Bacteroidales bacterium]
MKKLVLFLMCGLMLTGCATLKQRLAEGKINKKVSALSDLKGATVEPVTEADGSAALKVTFDSGILFEFNQSELSDEAKTQLSRLVQGISDMPDSRIRVYGHTDIVGTAEVNQAKSTQRANEVAKYLQEKGIAADRITAEGLSFNVPVADNSTEEGRAKNRRVEIYVVPAQ